MKGKEKTPHRSGFWQSYFPILLPLPPPATRSSFVLHLSLSRICRRALRTSVGFHKDLKPLSW
jgi:hypothetical protein